MRETHRTLTVAGLLLGLFLAAMEMTVVSTAMPTAIGDLGGVHLYAWVFAAYTLLVTVTVPISSKLGDLYGRKPVMLGGMVLFLAGSSLCGQAHSMTQLIVFRAIQGLGAGAVQPMTLTIVGDLFTIKQRAKMQGVFGAVWALAGLIGPLLGGIIVKYLSWRWVFYINLPFGLLSAALLVTAYHENVTRTKHQLDWLGAALLTAGIVLLLGQTRGAGVSPVTLLGVLALGAAFVFVEGRAAEPLLPIDLFRQRVMSTSSAAGALVGAGMFALVTFIPLYVQAVLGGSPTDAGTAISPMAIGWPVASAVGGRLLPRFGFRRFVRLGMAIAAIAGIGLAMQLRPSGSLGGVRLWMAALGIGMGLANTGLLIAVQASVDWKRRGVATGSTMFFRTIGGTIAVGMLGAIVARSLTGLPGIPSSAVDSLLGPGHGRDLPAAMAASIGASLAASLHSVFLIVAGLLVVAFLVSLAFPHVPIEDLPEQRPAEALPGA